jgi:hypothetical protein
MSFQVRCGKRMDGSGRSLVFSSPNYDTAKLSSSGFRASPAGDDRLPLPPGHPLSWDLLTLGTLLEGSTYADSL